MSYGLNKVTLIGNLGKDPELKYTDSQVPVTRFTLATDDSYKNQDGTRVDRTEWHNIVAWRKLGELFAQYLKKGSKVYLEGKLQTRSWDDNNGTKHYMTEIVVDEFVFLDSKGEGGGGGGGFRSEAPAPAASGDNADASDLPF